MPYEEAYGPRHPVKLTRGGILHRLTGREEIAVNSLHWQAIDRLADGLAIEAVAPDGVIEAVSVPGARSFALAVQWHPEYRTRENEASLAIFEAFAAAARIRARPKRAAETRLTRKGSHLSHANPA